jgi:hypothetical protein
MSRRSRLCLVTLFAVLCCPPAATAGELGFWRWWDSLSGPGPFNGIAYDQPLFTYGTKRDRANDPKGTFLDLTGLEADPSTRPVSIGVEWAVLWAEENNLEYAPPRDQFVPGVQAIPIFGTVDVGVTRAFDAGAAIGFVRFRGDGFGFNEFAWGPRLTVRPLALFAKDADRIHELVQVRLFGTHIVGEITAEEFGAVGAFEGGHEWLWGTTVTVNLLALMGR